MVTDITLPTGFELRLAQADDETFMEHLFCSCREHLYHIPLDRQQIDILIYQQYQLQQAAYHQQWPNAQRLMICFSGHPIGKIILDESETGLHIIDIVLEKSMRGKGLGTQLLHTLQNVASKKSLPIKLSVDRENLLAKKLYLALGFRVVTRSDTHECMEWWPSTPALSKMVASSKEQ